MGHVQQLVEVDVPVRVVYNQWTRFEEFPQFMGGVEEVRQTDDSHVHWVASIAGVRREWDAHITEQTPDRCISWVSTQGTANRGTVTFESLAPGRTRITLDLDFEPSGLGEDLADRLGVVSAMAKTDLERFRDLITSRGVAVGWRGEIKNGREAEGYDISDSSGGLAEFSVRPPEPPLSGPARRFDPDVTRPIPL